MAGDSRMMGPVTNYEAILLALEREGFQAPYGCVAAHQADDDSLREASRAAYAKNLQALRRALTPDSQALTWQEAQPWSDG